MNYFLSFLLFLFAVLTNLDLNFLGEYYLETINSPLEIFQSILLITTLLIHLNSRKMFLALSNIYFFNLRLFGFIFLLYEENSFLTRDVSTLFNSINHQAEVNFHNLNFANSVLFIKFPLINKSSSITVYLLLICLFLLMQSGSFLPYLKRFRYLFLEKNFAIFSYAFLLNLIFSVLVSGLLKNSFQYIIHLELCELFIYILFLFDVLQKKKLMKQKLV